MACTSCGTKSGGGCSPAGCKSNGTCGTSGCNALNVYDWFMDMELPDAFTPFGIVEVRFKGSRKEYYRNASGNEYYTGDQVWTESTVGMDIGTVSATGEIVRLQLKKKGISEEDPNLKKIVRKANEPELIKFAEFKAREKDILEQARTIAFELKLSMKISDIEYQGDGRKIIFFYTAEQRVDFRELIKRYSDQFKVKIEMRHISYREEASRLGGIGDCGRPLCCSTWLTDYKQVNIGAARTQNLSINMEKLAGQCGRLKCCLNFELDQYLEAVNDFPKLKIIKLNTEEGVAMSRKTDILKRLIWFSYEDNQNWVPIEVKKVNELIAKNQAGEVLPPLDTFAPEEAKVKVTPGLAAAEPEMIDNEQLLKEDKEFEEALRRQREKQERKNRNPKGYHNNNRNNQNAKDQDRQNRPRGNGGENNRGPRSNNQPANNNSNNNNNRQPGNNSNPGSNPNRGNQKQGKPRQPQNNANSNNNPNNSNNQNRSQGNKTPQNFNGNKGNNNNNNNNQQENKRPPQKNPRNNDNSNDMPF